MLRPNSITRLQPDPYGNFKGTNAPQGGVASKKLVAKNFNSSVANKKLAPSKLLPTQPKITTEAPKTSDVAMDAVAGNMGNVGKAASNIKNYTPEAGGMSKGGNAALQAGMVAASIGGDIATKKNNEILGGFLTGTAQGAGMGLSVGGPWGALAGGIIGGIAGTAGGIKKDRAGKKLTREANKEQKKLNLERDKEREKNILKAKELERYNQVMNASDNYDQYGNLRLKKGGILRYKTLNIKEIEEAKSFLEAEKAKENGLLKNKSFITEKFQSGGKLNPSKKQLKLQKRVEAVKSTMGSLKTTDIKEITAKLNSLPEYKDSKFDEEEVTFIIENVAKGDKKSPKLMRKGGKAGCGKSCSCNTCTKKKKITVKTVRYFRRGGSTKDLLKQHVIIDGPSHNEENNTGIKGDRGLPVVKNGKKIAEIESLELVIDSDVSKEIEKLVKLAKKGDRKSLEKLGDMMKNELSENTFDYSKLFV